MADSLVALEEWVAPLLEKLKPAERGKLARKIGMELARSQRTRIGQQRNPDGSPFAPRKASEPRAINRSVKFLYRKSSGGTRVASLAGYTDEGLFITGYDREVNAVRTFRKSRIEEWFKPDPGSALVKQRKGAVRRRPMFAKIRQARNLKNRSTPNAVIAGFVGDVARVARIHQYGLRERIKRGGPSVQYPQRRLLGFSDDDQVMIRDMLIDHLGGV